MSPDRCTQARDDDHHGQSELRRVWIVRDGCSAKSLDENSLKDFLVSRNNAYLCSVFTIMKMEVEKNDVKDYFRR